MAGMLAAGVALWQVWATWRHSVYFPPPSAIVAQMYHLWFSGPTSHLLLTPAATGNILPSLGRVAAGLAIAAADDPQLKPFVEQGHALFMQRQGQLNLDKIVSRLIGLDEVEESFEAMKRGETLRSVIVFDR